MSFGHRMGGIILFLVGIISAGLYLWVLSPSSDVHLEQLYQPTIATTTISLPDSVSIRHVYKDGVHRISGNIVLSHSCHKTESSVIPGNSRKGTGITIRIVDVRSSTKVCVNTKTPFPITILYDGAPENVFYLVANGTEIPLSVTEVDWNSAKDSGIQSDLPNPKTP